MAVEPIYTKGNAFFLGENRFLIKGISYHRRQPSDPATGEEGEFIDPLSEDHLEDLRRDMASFKDLGLNTIQIMGVDPSLNHEKAMNLLAEAGLYIILDISARLKLPKSHDEFDPNSDSSRFYTLYILRRILWSVDQFADYANLLGFSVKAIGLSMPRRTKIAEVYRAMIRDVKLFLRLRSGRVPPVGVNVNENPSIRYHLLHYFTAGASGERADFFGLENWSWAQKSSFQISGWKNLVERFEEVPVPMFLSAYGAKLGEARLWEEVGCLYSPDMTGVFSGGCAYTYLDEGRGAYGIVEAKENYYGHVEKTEDYQNLKRQMESINARSAEQLYTAEIKNYQDWAGTFPGTSPNRWYATSNVPAPPANVQVLYKEIQAGKQQNAEDEAKLSSRIEDLQVS